MSVRDLQAELRRLERDSRISAALTRAQRIQTQPQQSTFCTPPKQKVPTQPISTQTTQNALSTSNYDILQRSSPNRQAT